MAGTGTRVGGYEHSFVDPPDELMCMICHHVVREAHQVECCGKVFCKACITEVNRRMGRCPNCRKSSPKIFSDLRSSRDVKRLKVTCENEDKGCDWSGSMEDYETHSKHDCRFIEVQCPNGCGEKVIKGSLDEHLSSQCPKRMEACTVCHQSIAHEDVLSHADVCPKVEIECTNSGCNVKVFREHLAVHQNVCPKQVIDCPYIEAGCCVCILREDRQKHLQEYLEQHAMIASGKVKALTNMLTHVRKELTKSSESRCIPPVTFKMSNYERMKRHKETWTSPCFYSHPGGYKMFFKVRGDASNRYLSLYVHLTAGCNDEHLTWPYSGVVMIQILNQVSDSIHFERAIDWSKASVEKRVKPTEGSSSRYGIRQFVSRSILELGVYEDNTIVSSDTDSEFDLAVWSDDDREQTRTTTACIPKRRYVVDDCIFFRVSEVTSSKIHRPWLVCAK